MAKATDIEEWVSEAFAESQRRASSPEVLAEQQPADVEQDKKPYRKKRRSLLDGPAIRRALEMAEEEASQQQDGWKLLEPPPDSTSDDADPWRVLEEPPDSSVVATSPEAFMDPTQPEASWKVVATHEPEKKKAASGRSEQKSAPVIKKSGAGAAKSKATTASAKAGRSPLKSSPVFTTDRKSVKTTKATATAKTNAASKQSSAAKPAARAATKPAARTRTPTPILAPKTSPARIPTPAPKATSTRTRTPTPKPSPVAATRVRTPTPKPISSPTTATAATKAAAAKATTGSAATTGNAAATAKPNLGYKRSFTPATQVPRPVGTPGRARMATLMGVQPPALPQASPAVAQPPPLPPAAPAAERNPALDKTMLAGDAPPAVANAVAAAQTGPGAKPSPAFEPPAARARAKPMRATMMGVAPPPLPPENIGASGKNPALEATMLGGPPPGVAAAAMPAHEPTPATTRSPRASQASFADTMLAVDPGRKSAVPAPPQVAPTPAQLAAVPPPIEAPLTLEEQALELLESLPPDEVLPDEGVAPAVPAAPAQVVNAPAPAYPSLLREESASEPSLSGLARTSVIPKSSLIRKPWLWAAAGVALLAVPITAFALLSSGGAAEKQADGARVAEPTKKAATTTANKQSSKARVAKPKKPSAQAKTPEKKTTASSPKPAQAEKAIAKTPEAPKAKPKAKQDASPAPSEPRAIPWQDIEPSSTKECKDLVEVAEGASAYRFTQALKAAQLAMVQGKVDAAHQAFCEASLLSEPAPAVLTGLAQVLLIKNDLTRALATADQLLEVSPKSARAYNLRGDILIRMGKVDEAKEAWMRAAKATTFSSILQGNIVRASHQGAREAMRAGDLARADRMLRRALAIDPKDVTAAAKLALVLHKNGVEKAARLWLDYAKSLDANHEQVQRVEEALS